jgi:hypothetical protein
MSSFRAIVKKKKNFKKQMIENNKLSIEKCEHKGNECEQ